MVSAFAERPLSCPCPCTLPLSPLPVSSDEADWSGCNSLCCFSGALLLMCDPSAGSGNLLRALAPTLVGVGWMESPWLKMLFAFSDRWAPAAASWPGFSRTVPWSEVLKSCGTRPVTTCWFATFNWLFQTPSHWTAGLMKSYLFSRVPYHSSQCFAILDTSGFSWLYQWCPHETTGNSSR